MCPQCQPGRLCEDPVDDTEITQWGQLIMGKVRAKEQWFPFINCGKSPMEVPKNH